MAEAGTTGRQTGADPRDLAETRAELAATRDVLRTLSRSPRDLQAVLDSIVEHAMRLCDADDALVNLVRGEHLPVVAHRGRIAVAAQEEHLARPDWVAGRAVLERRTIHVEDVTARTQDFPRSAEWGHRYGIRTTLAVVDLREVAAMPAQAAE